MRKRRLQWLSAVTTALAGAVAWEGLVVHWLEPLADPSYRDTRSSDLASDLRLMREKEWGFRDGPATDRAMNAASRVFSTVELVGKTREEVWALLGYRAPTDAPNLVWPAPAGTLEYRVCNHTYGWWFHVWVGDDGRVRAVKQHWTRWL